MNVKFREKKYSSLKRQNWLQNYDILLRLKAPNFTLSKKWHEGFGLRGFRGSSIPGRRKKRGGAEEYSLSLDSMTLRDGTERLSRNVAKWSQTHES
jgi:hypothetical protein